MSVFNGIAMSGGGLKGFGILGGIQYMMDNKLINDIKYYSGTSIGAIICYFLAIGYTPIEMIVYIITHNVFETNEHKGIEAIFKGEGVYDFSIFEKHFVKMTLEKIDYIPTLLELYEKMDKTLFTCTYNITQKKKEYISYHTYPNMSCIDAIKLSSSLPFIFNDCIYNEEIYIDGGFVDNCPFLPIFENITDNVELIVFNTGQKGDDEYKTLIDKFYTIIMVPINELLKLQIKNMDKCKFIHIEIEPIKIYYFRLNNSKKLELFSTGYNSTKKSLTN